MTSEFSKENFRFSLALHETRFLTQVVDSHLHLEAICCLGVGAHHHTCIIDQKVEMLFLCREEKIECRSGQSQLLHLRNLPHNQALKMGMYNFNLSSIFPFFIVRLKLNPT